MSNFEPDEKMLNNYIQDKLNESDTKLLELWLVDHPETIQELELDLMFKQANFDPKIIANSTLITKPNWLANLFLKPVMVLSHAAVFALGMLLFYLQGNINNIEISNPKVAMFSQFRGENNRIRLSNSKGLLIQIPVDYLSQNKYQISIYDKNNYQFIANDLMPESDIVSLYIPQDKLKNGDYTLELINLDSKDETKYIFEINN